MTAHPDWTALAAAIIHRLRAAAAAAAPGDEEEFAPVDPPEPSPLASFAAALPQLPPDEHADVLETGGDPFAIDAGGRDRPAVPLPTPRIMLTVRLARTFGSPVGIAELLAPGSLALLGGMRAEEIDPLAQVLRQGVFPGACRPDRARLAARDGASGLILLAPRIDEGRVTSRDVAAFARSIETALEDTAPVLILQPLGCRLPAELMALLPEPIPLAPLDRESVLVHVRHSHSATGRIAAAEVCAALPPDAALARLAPAALNLAFRGRTSRDVAARLAAASTADARDGPTLDDIAGYGEAERVARSMVRDLQGWAEGKVSWTTIPRSVLFHGPPGSGKTYLARAMGNAPGITLVAASFGQWQARGHLGQMLEGMYRSFAEARAARPAILFIDEIDAVGARAGSDIHNAHYRRQVVNAFLELLDGTAEREGVLLVGATNAPGAIDPAILRPGRFDVLVEVPLPGPAALETILRTHLPPEVPGSEIPPLARVALGRSAAHVDAAIRTVKSRARSAGRRFSLADLRAELAPEIGARTDRDWRIAVHETGHAVLAACLGRGTIDRILLTPAGGELHLRREADDQLLADYEAELAVLLAGRAAEQLVFGTVSGGAGGGAGCDLAQATHLAVGIEIGLGLGDEGAVWMRLPEEAYLRDLAARSRVRARLDAAEERAHAELRGRRAAVLGMARDLHERRVLEGDDLACWLEDLGHTRTGRH